MLTIFLAASMVAAAAPVAAAVVVHAGRCDWAKVQAGKCPPDGGAVEIGDTETSQSPGSNGTENNDDSGLPAEPGASDVSEPPKPRPITDTCRDDVHEYQSCLGGVRVDEPATPIPPAPEAPGTPGRSITITDVARFVPTNATVAGEPDNIAVVGLPANFLSSARTETIPGTILGRTLTIRFTPVNYSFDYGDGERRDSATPGTAWDASGQAQFTPTDTSHVYKEPGTYTVTATVTYTADIDIGTGWIPVNGTLNGPSASQQIRVVKAHTALVQNTCPERPTAPGC
ncbi:PKD domain-containing protein [Microbacterium sp. 22242]|uniref:PKD domain-containing protein n=1 Tax=Microbacterium sp. 22242 TaxID=3453896 RepID=UPI003F859E3A